MNDILSVKEAGEKMTKKIGRATSEDLPAAADLSVAAAGPAAAVLSQPTIASSGAEEMPTGPETMLDYAALGRGPAPDENAKTPAQKVFPKQGEALAQDGDNFIYRGFAGIPFRSKSATPPDIKAKDSRQPRITADAKAEIFDFGDPKHLERYTLIFDKAAKGIYEISTEERQWVPELKTWKVFLRYGVKYWELPDA